MSPRIYALVLSAVAATVFFGIAAANVIIDPQGIFGTNLIHSINANQRYLRFAAYQRRQDRFDGVLFGSSRAQQMPKQHDGCPRVALLEIKIDGG